ncbi:MAG: hypothetical protein QNK04_22570 [Myxococcota bacterium]|nr:hypothetical protein [Myxococcota bacterium]
MSDAPQAVRRAADFVAGAGDALLSRWAAVLVGEGNAQGAAEAIVRLQAPNGSFGDVAATRRVLSLLADVGASGGPVQEAAGRWLATVQDAEGYWGEGDAAPFETGVLVGLLARVPTVRRSFLEAAADWLAGRFGPESVQNFQWLPLAGYAAAFANLPHDSADGILQWCGRELERGFRTEHFDAVLTARVLLWCDAPSLPGARLSGDEVARALVAQQEDDGGWPAPPERRVARAWDGLVALLKLGASGA